MHHRRSSLQYFMIASLLALICHSGWAQSPPGWRPGGPVRLVVGFAAGSGSDVIARLIAPRLTHVLGQPVVVENRPGAGGALAAEAFAKTSGDGRTWLLVASAHATTAAMRRSLPYQPIRDFAWISTITTYPLIVAVAPGAPYAKFGELLRGAKSKHLSFSSVGLGTAHHLVGEWINSAAGTDLLHVPFKGGGAAATEVMSGRVDAMIDTMTFVLPMVQSGQLRPLAVTSATPVPSLPGVPTVASSLPDVIYESWLGIALPGSTRPEIVVAVNAAVRHILEDDAVKKRLAELGGRAAPSSPEAFRSRVESDIAKFKQVVQSRNIELE